MNVLHQGAELAQMGWMLGVTTLLFLSTLVGWTVWAYAPGQRRRMEEAARIPLDGGDT